MKRRTSRPIDRGRLPWLGIMVPLALGFVFSLGLAYQTWDTGREHRAAAEATVRDHAAFGAHILAGRIDRRMSGAMLYAFYYVDLGVRDGERWPGVEALRAEQELARCEAVIPRSERVFFRFADGVLDIDGSYDPGLRPWLESWVEAASTAPPGGRSFGLRFGAPGISPAGVAYRVFRRDGEVALYGLDNCFRDPSGDVFEEAVTEGAVLPPALVGETPADSMFSLSVRGGGTWIRGDGYSDGYIGKAAVEPTAVYEDLSLELRLQAATAERLVIGGLPRSRLPEALGLVALTALLLGVAAGQLRRGEELVRMRERFVASVSHELRTPLQQILLFSDLLRLKRVSGEEARHAEASIHRETRRLINLIENVLWFSRPGSAPLEAPTGETELLTLATKTAESFRPIAEERGALLDVHGGEVVVRADPESLQRVLLNLLDNAVKYGPDGQTVRVSVTREDGSGVVLVSDEGPGIPRDARESVWEPYFRLAREERGNEVGQGIGLAIVNDLVERLGGRVGVVDGAGGACIRVEIPVIG